MDPTVILGILTIGIILLLVGLVGKVKAKEIEVGTNNKVARVTIGVLGLGLTALAIYAFIKSGEDKLLLKSTPTPTTAQAEVVSQATVVPPAASATQPPAAPPATQAPVKPPTDTPGAGLVLGSTRNSAKDGMIMLYVPAGNFSMGDSAVHALAECKRVGSTQCDTISFSSESPMHKVSLNAFWIDQTEVTDVMYSQCVQAGQCISNGAGSDYLPAVNVSWQDASDYCAWAGRRLPSEAEWEKAARGTDGRTFPWGNGAPSCSLANFAYASGTSCAGGLAAVGSYLGGTSYSGAWDMGGNAWEWVADWYAEGYGPAGYASTPVSNPSGPSPTGNRVMRGGSFGNPSGYMTTTGRGYNTPDTKTGWIGFRCAANP